MIGWKWILGTVVGVSLAFGAGSAGAADAPMRNDGMQAGLAIDYYYGDFGHVDKVTEYAASNEATPGEPLPNLDFRGGAGKKSTQSKT